MTEQNLLDLLHFKNPYKDYDPLHITTDFGQSIKWGSTEGIFEYLICDTQPDIIIEVGTWKGASAIHMGRTLKKHKVNGQIICVDTWLGGISYWTDVKDQQTLKMVNGYPSIYFQFLRNVIANNLQSMIIPLPQTSSMAAKILKHYNIKADMIYIDASHEEDDVRHDLVDYWELLKDGGTMFGDDYFYREGVKKAVDEFYDENYQFIERIIEGRFWIFEKYGDL